MQKIQFKKKKKNCEEIGKFCVRFTMVVYKKIFGSINDQYIPFLNNIGLPQKVHPNVLEKSESVFLDLKSMTFKFVGKSSQFGKVWLIPLPYLIILSK